MNKTYTFTFISTFFQCDEKRMLKSRKGRGGGIWVTPKYVALLGRLSTAPLTEGRSKQACVRLLLMCRFRLLSEIARAAAQ
jgi:hypothetical protein